MDGISKLSKTDINEISAMTELTDKLDALEKKLRDSMDKVRLDNCIRNIWENPLVADVYVLTHEEIKTWEEK